MEMRAELLKSIWYAFTSLDVEKSGKVSKSQLKVLSHNLYTVLNIPHDPGSLEEHFKDDDDGPVSTQGYMPYLNKFILDKVVEGTFNKVKVDELCWLLCAKKNYRPDLEHNLLQGPEDAFRLWSLFNFLSEDSYPLVLLPEELEYLLKKVCAAMNVELSYVDMEDFISQDAVRQSGITVWLFLEWVGSGRLSRGVDRERLTVAIQHVYQEMILNVIKEGYLWKKGHVRRNWNERWFRLSSSRLVYYDSEENREEKGCIDLDHNCCVEVLPDREGKRCMFCVKTLTKTYEMSAADSKQRQEWTSAIQTALRLCLEGRGLTQHAQLKTQRRQQRAELGQRQAAKEEELQRLHLLQAERDTNLVQLQLLQGAQRQAQADLLGEETRWRQQHEELNRALQQQLHDAEQARANMQEELSQKEEEAERQRRRIRDLEETQKCLEEALQEQVRTRRDEEAFCLAQARLLAEEEEKTKALLALQEEQERYIVHTQQEQHELRQEMELKTQALQEAHRQLDKVRSSRQRVDLDIQAAQRKLRQVSTSVKHWNIQMNRLMRPIGPAEKRLSTGSSGLPPVPLPKTRDPVPHQLLQKTQRDAEGHGHVVREEGTDSKRRQEDI